MASDQSVTKSLWLLLVVCFCLLDVSSAMESSTSAMDRADSVDGSSGAPDATSSHSKVAISINSGCPYSNCSLNGTTGITIANLTVIDKPAEETENHWMWSVIGHPTIQAAITKPGNLLDIDWNSIFGFGSLARSISYQEKPLYTSAVMMMRLIEFNDTDKTGKLEANYTDVISYDLVHFDWERVLIENNDERVAVQLIGSNYTSDGEHTLKSGKINLTLAGYSTEGFGHWLPHLSHSRKTNQFDIQLDELKTTSGYNSSRFALELAIVSDNEDYQHSNLTRRKSTTLDDEHTPGIFITEELVIPGGNDSLQSYLQWRPVVYTTQTRELSSSTNLHVSDPRDLKEPANELNNTLLYALYGTDLDSSLVKTINVSFGGVGDGFYNKTQYQAWTFTIGVGEPIQNGLSPQIILTMVGLSITILFSMAVSLIMCCIKKWKNRLIANQYESLNRH